MISNSQGFNSLLDYIQLGSDFLLSMPSYIILALAFAIGRALVTIYQKYISEYLEHDWKVFTFLFYFSGLLMSFVFYLVSPWEISLRTLSATWPAGVTFFLGGVTMYYALFKTDVSVFGGLQPLKLIFVVILAGLMLGENFSVITYVLIALLILSSFLVVVDEKVELSDFLNKQMFVNFISLGLFALCDVFTKKAIGVIPPISAMSANLLFSGLLSLLMIPFIVKDLRKISIKQVQTATMNSIMTFLVVVLLIIAFKDNVTISNVISNLTGPFVLIFMIFLGRFHPDYLEHHTKNVYNIRLLGAVLSYIFAIGIVLTTT